MGYRFRAKEAGGIEHEYEGTVLVTDRYNGEIWHFLYGRRHSLHREIWDVLRSGQDAGKLLDYADRLAAMGEGEDGESE